MPRKQTLHTKPIQSRMYLQWTEHQKANWHVSANLTSSKYMLPTICTTYTSYEGATDIRKGSHLELVKEINGGGMIIIWKTTIWMELVRTQVSKFNYSHQLFPTLLIVDHTSSHNLPLPSRGSIPVPNYTDCWQARWCQQLAQRLNRRIQPGVEPTTRDVVGARMHRNTIPVNILGPEKRSGCFLPPKVERQCCWMRPEWPILQWTLSIHFKAVTSAALLDRKPALYIMWPLSLSHEIHWNTCH